MCLGVVEYICVIHVTCVWVGVCTNMRFMYEFYSGLCISIYAYVYALDTF